MPSPDEIFSSLGLDRLFGNRGFTPTDTGTLAAPGGGRVVCAPAEFLRSFRFVLEKESPGTWKSVLKSSGRAVGQDFAIQIDAELTRRGKSPLNTLPLETCLVLIEHYFALHGWGRVKLDLTAATEHGVVVARLEQSGFAESLADVDDFVDPLLAGTLQGFFEHISGEALGCEEIACVRRGAACCTFAITASERLGSITAWLGKESADAIIARLTT